MRRSALLLAGGGIALALAVVAFLLRYAPKTSGPVTAQASPAAPEEGASVLVGADTPEVRVLIWRIDEGPVLLTTPTTLGTRASIRPGDHRVNVVCEFKDLVAAPPLLPSDLSNDVRFGTLVGGDVSVEVGVDKVYDLRGALSKDGESCDVSVSSRS